MTKKGFAAARLKVEKQIPDAEIFEIRANSGSFDYPSARRKGCGGKEKARTLHSG
jgi:hypothetical protein